MSNNVNQKLLGVFPLTAPDLAATSSPGGMAQDADALMSETLSEIQNLQQDLTNRLIETPGSNLDFLPDRTRGVGIMLYASATSDQIAGLPTRIDKEFEKDPRVTGSYTVLQTQPDGSTLIASSVTTVVGVFGLGWIWSSQGIAPAAAPAPM